SKYSTLSASGLPNHEAQSLHLRYGPDVALPTLSPCRYLHAPKARFQVGRLFPLPGRELHPLEAPGFAWRAEVLRHIGVDDLGVPLINRLMDPSNRIERTSVWAIPIGCLIEVRFEDRFEHQHRRGLYDPIADRRDAERPLTRAPRFGNH